MSNAALKGRHTDVERAWRESISRGLQRRHGLTGPTRDIELVVVVGVAVLRAALDEWAAADRETPSKDRLLRLIDAWFDALRSGGSRWATAD